MAPPKGYKHSKESLRKISIASKERAIRYGYRVSFKGRKHTEVTKRNLSKIAKMSGRLPPSRKGIPLTEDTKRKMSQTRKGRKFTDEWRKNMSEAEKGEKSHFWKGGITDVNLQIRHSFEYKEWRRTVFERDNYTCTWCDVKGGWNKEQKKKINLNADHIKRFALHPELRFSLDNGRTLCEDCHKTAGTFGRLNNKTL